jgi:hypothetical protein
MNYRKMDRSLNALDRCLKKIRFRNNPALMRAKEQGLRAVGSLREEIEKEVENDYKIKKGKRRKDNDDDWHGGRCLV